MKNKYGNDYLWIHLHVADSVQARDTQLVRRQIGAVSRPRLLQHGTDQRSQ